MTAQKGTTTRINLHITSEARDRLHRHAFATGSEPGRVLEQLIMGLPRWAILAEPDDGLNRPGEVQISGQIGAPTYRPLRAGRM
jgi:hypothetical protein